MEYGYTRGNKNMYIRDDRGSWSEHDVYVCKECLSPAFQHTNGAQVFACMECRTAAHSLDALFGPRVVFYVEKLSALWCVIWSREESFIRLYTTERVLLDVVWTASNTNRERLVEVHEWHGVSSFQGERLRRHVATGILMEHNRVIGVKDTTVHV